MRRERGNKKGVSGKGASKTAVKVYSGRFFGIRCLISLLIVSVLCRLVYLQVINRPFLKNQGDQRSVRALTVPANRGVVFDRNGLALAVSTPVISIWANPGELIRERDRWAQLASLLSMDSTALARRLETGKSLDFMYLKRQMIPDEAQRILDKKIPGVYSIREYRRYYPMGAVTAQLVGMTNIDHLGQSGLELTYNRWLSGRPGKQRIIHDLHGHMIDKAEVIKSAVPGRPLYLSIDSRLQYLAYRALVETVDKHQATSGSIVMMNAHNGEVLAMVNLPSFNPNNRQKYTPSAARNRAVSDQYEPGSTIKAFTVAAALDSGFFTPQTLIDTAPGRMTVQGYTVRDDKNHGKLDVASVLTKSSNIGVSKMAFAIGQPALTQTLRSFGFGQPAGIAFPGEALGSVPSGKRISKIGLANLAFGYHLSLTPLQLVRAYTALASGGVLYPASLIKLNAQPPGERIISEKVSLELMGMLKTVITKGTGRKAKVSGYTVAGKTGTSHKAGENGYKKNSYYSSFVGVVPADNPEIVMLVILDSVTKGSYFGGTVAGPVFSRVAGESLRVLGVPPDAG